MIPKNIEEIELQDLRYLIENKIIETKKMEYKSDFPGKEKKDKNYYDVLLQHICSFANTDGGDLIIGIEEKEGFPNSICGISTLNPDDEKLKIENKIRDGLEPRIIGTEIRSINLKDDKYVFIIRVKKSWIGPHRVRKNNHFYARNSAGKHTLDVGELRTAFTLSVDIANRIKNFRIERITQIYGDEGPVQLGNGIKVILHLIPLSAFASNIAFNIVELRQKGDLEIRPIGTHDYPRSSYYYPINSRINLDGIVWFNGSDNVKPYCFTQLYRSGIIESVKVLDEEENKGIRFDIYEREIKSIVSFYLEQLKFIGVNVPIFLFLTFTGVMDRHLSFFISQPDNYENGHPIDRDIIQLPEQTIESYSEDIVEILRPLFYLVCNASGLLRSTNFAKDGKWKYKSRGGGNE